MTTNKIFGFLVVSCIGLYACGKSSPSNPTNVFGNDNREKITSFDSPYDAVGRIEESGCTATLIGRSMILTAGHCLWSETSRTASHKEFTFSLAVRDGQPRVQAKIVDFWLGSEEPESKRVTDFAIARLDRDISAFGRPVLIQPRTTEVAVFTTNLIAYSQDFDGGKNPSVHRNCKVMETDGARWLNECDGKRGMSGGPLVDVAQGKPTIVGIAVSEFRNGAPDSVSTPAWSKELSNVAISASQFSQLAASALPQFDGNLNRGSVVEGFNYYSMAELTGAGTQLPPPNPTPIPNPNPQPNPTPTNPDLFQGNWGLTDAGVLFLRLPQERLTYLARTRQTLSTEYQNVTRFRSNLDIRYNYRTAVASYLESAAQCLIRLDALVSVTGDYAQGMRADQEIRNITYSCVQRNLFAAYESWENLPSTDGSLHRLDISFFNAIFADHRAVFLDLYNVQRNI